MNVQAFFVFRGAATTCWRDETMFPILMGMVKDYDSNKQLEWPFDTERRANASPS